MTGLNFFGFNNTDKKPKSNDPLLQRLDKINDSYSPDNTSYRFQAVFYIPKSSSYSSNKPNCVTQEEWNKIEATTQLLPNSDKVQAKILCGFDQLNERIKEQASLVERMKNKLISLQDKIDDMREKYSREIKDRLTELTDKNNEINLELIKYLQVEEVKSLQAYPFTKEENEIYDRLEELSQEIHKPNKFKFSLNTLDLNSKIIRENFENKTKIDVPQKSIDSAKLILRTNSNALKSLTTLIKQIYKTTDAISNQLNI